MVYARINLIDKQQALLTSTSPVAAAEIEKRKVLGHLTALKVVRLGRLNSRIRELGREIKGLGATSDASGAGVVERKDASTPKIATAQTQQPVYKTSPLQTNGQPQEDAASMSVGDSVTRAISISSSVAASSDANGEEQAEVATSTIVRAEDEEAGVQAKANTHHSDSRTVFQTRSSISPARSG